MFSKLTNLVFILYLCVPIYSWGQGLTPYAVGISAQQAGLLIHSPRMTELSGTYPYGMEVNLQLQTTGSRAWHQNYRYPRIGVSLLWLDYNNPALGHSFAFSPYFSKPFHRSERQELHLRLGTGLAYFTNKFHPDDNPINHTISNNLNAVMQVRLDYDYKISKHLSLNAAAGLHHYSNGARRKPNLGLNLPTISLGINYYSNPDLSYIEVVQAPFKPKSFLDFSASIGLKRTHPDDTEKYKAKSFSLTGGRTINRKSNLVFGFEGFYDRSLYKLQEGDNQLDPEDILPDVKRLGLIGGHELVIGRLLFQTHLGVYVYRPYKVNTFYYQRVGLKYLVTNHLFGAIDLKVHGGSADVIEFKLGARPPFRK